MPVSSPAPFSAAVAQKYDSATDRRACGQTAVTPVWSGHVVGVADAHAGDIGDRVRRPRGELSYDEAVVARAHRPKLAGTQ